MARAVELFTKKSVPASPWVNSSATLRELDALLNDVQHTVCPCATARHRDGMRWAVSGSFCGSYALLSACLLSCRPSPLHHNPGGGGGEGTVTWGMSPRGCEDTVTHRWLLYKRGGGQKTSVSERGGGGGFGLTPWCDDLVCSWRGLLAERGGGGCTNFLWSFTCFFGSFCCTLFLKKKQLLTVFLFVNGLYRTVEMARDFGASYSGGLSDRRDYWFTRHGATDAAGCLLLLATLQLTRLLLAASAVTSPAVTGPLPWGMGQALLVDCCLGLHSGGSL